MLLHWLRSRTVRRWGPHLWGWLLVEYPGDPALRFAVYCAAINSGAVTRKGFYAAALRQLIDQGERISHEGTHESPRWAWASEASASPSRRSAGGRHGEPVLDSLRHS